MAEAQALTPSDDSPTGDSRIASPRFLATAVLCGGVIALITAIPTAILQNPWFTRMTPVYADQYLYWIVTSALGGLLAATYLLPRAAIARRGPGTVGGGLLVYLAIGCPICNKLIIALIGVSGALSYFAPIQPYLGAAGVLLVSVALTLRLRDLRSNGCRLPS